MTDVKMGTLYDLNKELVEKNEKKLSQEVINKKKIELIKFLTDIKNNYYMLLCNDRKDYTVFNLEDWNSEKQKKELVEILVEECLKNRGIIKGFDLTKDKQAFEIWLSIDNESYVYFFFPYDSAIILIKEV